MNELSEVVVQIPKHTGLDEFEIKMLVASKLFEAGKITSGQGAEIVGISKRTFIELLGKYDISVFGYELDDEELALL